MTEFVREPGAWVIERRTLLNGFRMQADQVGSIAQNAGFGTTSRAKLQGGDFSLMCRQVEA